MLQKLWCYMNIDLSIFFRLRDKDPSLTEICAKGMVSPISDDDVKALVMAAKNSEHLKSLILLDGDITSVGAELISSNLQFLEKIDLSCNKIDFAGLVALSKMPKLKQLTLIGNNFSPDCLSKLQYENDDLKIVLSNNNLEPVVFSSKAKKIKAIDPLEMNVILSDIGNLWGKLLQKIDPQATGEEREEYILEMKEQVSMKLESVSKEQFKPRPI